MTISFVIVAYRSDAIIGDLLKSIQQQAGEFQREIIVVDNSPSEPSLAAINRSGVAVSYIVNPENRGFTAAVNQGIARSSGDFVFLLNPDVRLGTDCARVLIGALAASPEIMAAAPQLRSPDGRIQPSVRNFPTFMTLLWEFTLLAMLFSRSNVFGHWKNLRFDHATRTFVTQPMAAALLLKREAIAKIGRWDEQFFVFFSDVDYCKRLYDAGGKIIFEPVATAIHQVGGSTRGEGLWLIRDSHRGFYRYLVKHELRGWKSILRPLARTMLELGGLLRILARRIRWRSF